MRKLIIDVSFDLICPWCMIGKRQLALALQALRAHAADVQTRVRWQGQVLLPDVPEEGLPFRAFYERRLGSAQAVAQRQDQVRAAARAVGLSLNFDRMEVLSSTRMAHHMIANTSAVYGAALAEKLIDALFVSYFQLGRDIGSKQVLAQVAHELGIDSLVFNSVNATRSAYLWWRDAQPSGLTQGVPRFVFNNCVEVQGAVQHDVLLAAMLQTLRHQEPSVSVP